MLKVKCKKLISKIFIIFIRINLSISRVHVCVWLQVQSKNIHIVYLELFVGRLYPWAFK